MPTSREYDDNGFVLVRGCPISSFGIFDYGAGQLGLPGDPMRIVKVYRPESAVMDAAAIESFKNVPFIIDHVMLSGNEDAIGAVAPEEKGLDGVLTGNVYYDAPWMRGDLKIFTRKAQAALAAGKRDLSLGYSCDFEEKPGVWNGQAYEVIQTNLRGNHIALVDEGRVPGARVLDGLCFDHLSFKPTVHEESDMSQKGKVAMDNAIQQLLALLPALQTFLKQEATEPAHQEGAAGAEGAAPAAAGAAPAEGAAPAAVDPSQVDGGEGSEGGEQPAPAAAPASAEGGENPDAIPATSAAAPEGAAPAQAAAPDMNQLIASVETVLAQLKAACGGAADQGEGANEGQPGQEGADNVEGMEGTVQDGEGNEGAGIGEGQGKASPGPAAGTHAQAGDAALRRFYADLDAKNRVYNRLSAVVGAFDHAAMDAHQVHAYGVKKLGIKCAKGQEAVALDAYLTGVEKAATDTKQRVQPKLNAADSASTGDEALDKYLKGAK